MKILSTLTALSLLLAIAAGCKKKEEPKAKQPAATAPDKLPEDAAPAPAEPDTPSEGDLLNDE